MPEPGHIEGKADTMKPGSPHSGLRLPVSVPLRSLLVSDLSPQETVCAEPVGRIDSGFSASTSGFLIHKTMRREMLPLGRTGKRSRSARAQFGLRRP